MTRQIRVSLFVIVSLTALAAQAQPIERQSLIAAEEGLRAEINSLTRGSKNIADATDALRQAAEILESWVNCFLASQASHTAWMVAFLEAESMYNQDRDLPLEGQFLLLQEKVHQLQRTLPDTDPERLRGQETLNNLFSLIDNADRALSASGSAAFSVGARRADVTIDLQTAQRSLGASLAHARQAYTLVNAQADSRMRLSLAMSKIWKDRLELVAARTAGEVAHDLISQHPLEFDRLLLPERWQHEFEVQQRDIDRMAPMPTLAMRAQRVLGSILEAREAWVCQREAAGEDVGDLRAALESITSSHRRAIEAMRQTNTYEKYFFRLAHIGSSSSSYGDDSNVCVYLARVAASRDNVTSEEAYGQWRDICSAR